MGWLAPPRGYISTALGGSITIRTPPSGSTCEFPEIASVDENNPARIGAADFDFSVVWQEFNPAPGIMVNNIWYHDGTTQIWPGFANVLNPAGPGIISWPIDEDCTVPDIAATQDYIFGAETYYFHVNWVHVDSSITFNIDSSYTIGPVTLPGPAPFVQAPTAQSTGVGLDNPTIASKLIALGGVFETWMAWEDWSDNTATNPDIWYIVGICVLGSVPPFSYPPGGGPGRVQYTPGKGKGTREWNPELWNRNDQVRIFNPLTHLVFDQDTGAGTAHQVEYIDP